jgi:hypothetical protein
MDTSVETNLGVVSSPAVPPAVPQSDQNASESGQQTDMPAAQAIEDSQAVQPEQAADDLPVLDSGEPDSTDSGPGGTAPGTGSDDS